MTYKESMRLSKANYNSISYPYNSAYMKLFSTFDNNAILLCQFYSGEFELCVRYTNFELLCQAPALLTFCMKGLEWMKELLLRLNMVSEAKMFFEIITN